MATSPTTTPDGAAPGDTYRLLNQIAERIARYTLHGVIIMVACFYALDPGVPSHGIAITTALAVYSAGRLLSRRASRGWVVTDVAVVAVYLLLTPWLVVDDRFASGTSAMLAVAGAAVIVYGLSYHARWSVVAAVVVALAGAVGIARVGSVTPWSVFSLDYLLVEWALAAWFRRLVERAATVTDEVLAGIADDEVVRSVAVARHRLARQQFATMHDTAASTLLMVGQGAATNRDALACQANRDLAAIASIATPSAGAPARVAVLERLRRVVGEIRTPVTLTGDPTVLADRDIADALAGATHEALTNVDRHAQADAAGVTVGDGTVTIVDDGVGFDPAGEQVARRFGVRNSIQHRLADIGGHARIDSAPGRGTVVTLCWGQPVHPDRMDPADCAETTARLLREFGYGLFGIALVVVLLRSSQAIAADVDHRAAEAAIIVVAVCCALVAGAAVERQVPRWLVCIAYGTSIGVVCVQQFVLPATMLTHGANWTVWTMGWVVVALTYRSPAAAGLVALAVFWAIGVVVLLVIDPSRAAVVTIGYHLAGIAVIQALALVFTTFLVSVADEARTANEERTRRWASEARERALADDVADRYAALSRSLIPLLHKLSDPSVDATSPEVRLAAVIEGARLRRLFAQIDNDGHPLLRELQPAIAAAEERGVLVAVDAGAALPEISATGRDRLLGLVSMMLSVADSCARVVFSPEGGTVNETDRAADDGAVTASVVADCDGRAGELESALGVDVVVAGDLVWAELTVPLRERELQGSAR